MPQRAQRVRLGSYSSGSSSSTCIACAVGTFANASGSRPALCAVSGPSPPAVRLQFLRHVHARNIQRWTRVRLLQCAPGTYSASQRPAPRASCARTVRASSVKTAASSSKRATGATSHPAASKSPPSLARPAYAQVVARSTVCGGSSTGPRQHAVRGMPPLAGASGTAAASTVQAARRRPRVVVPRALVGVRGRAASADAVCDRIRRPWPCSIYLRRRR